MLDRGTGVDILTCGALSLKLKKRGLMNGAWEGASLAYV